MTTHGPDDPMPDRAAEPAPDRAADPAPDRGLDRVLDLAQAALDEPDRGGAHFARRAHLSRFHFDRLVSAAAGEAPGALRRRLLLERAAHRLVARPHERILDVAVEAGYGSHEAFTRAFARAYGRSPADLRRTPPLTFHDLELPAASGVHFHPPGGLRLPADHQESSMDVLQHLVDHHVDSLTRLLSAAGQVDPVVLDRPIEISVEGLDDDPTLRSTLAAMVTQEEHWLHALRGLGWPDDRSSELDDLAARHDVAGRDLREVVARAIAGGTLADSFVDTTCEPPTTFTLGGVVAHLVTFAAVRRTLAVGALWTAGQRLMPLADPRAWVDQAAAAR